MSAVLQLPCPTARPSGNHARIHRMFGPQVDFTCFYCSVPVQCSGGIAERHLKASVSGTLDHVVPTSRGGDDSPGNLVMACRRCNGVKTWRIWPDEWFPGHEDASWAAHAQISFQPGDKLAVMGVVALLAQIPPGAPWHLSAVAKLVHEGPQVIRQLLDGLVATNRLARVVRLDGKAPYAHEYRQVAL